MRSSFSHFFSIVVIVFAFVTSAEGQLEARIEPARLQDSLSTISIRWDEKDEQKWHDENDGMLDIMGISTGLSSASLAKVGHATTYFFDFEDDATIELLIDDMHFASDPSTSGEMLVLFDFKAGKIFYDFAMQGKKRALSPPFDPKTVGLVWRRTHTLSYEATFSISKIYYQKTPDARTRGIGFNTALPCHPNAACRQDSIGQLISNSAVRMRMVMEEGIGWCTGAFVNTTRNDKTPYLLSAYHCQYDYTPLYDMWRFDFKYKSHACQNPNEEPDFTSLTGCTLISLGQESDFLLVLLDEEIPVNEQVTFAGWDRDEDAKPDTSYLIHHPNADIRKISTCVNEATIHPNSINWTEGYTTPSHHHFRMKFTEGGHQPGSSGGPLFNENGLLVGQLHGGTTGCEAENNTYIGRFSKSWNLGATAQERLGDWLDPDQTGLKQVASLPNIDSDDAITLRGVVRDPSGNPVKNAVVTITGSAQEEYVTDADGVFELPGVNRNGTYTIRAEKNDNPVNGLNALDLVAIQKHLLGKDTFDFNWQLIAADATHNDDLSVGDIVVLLRLLLGKINVLPSSPSWRFDPQEIVVDPDFPDDPSSLEIMGIKIGDVNGTANASE